MSSLRSGTREAEPPARLAVLAEGSQVFAEGGLDLEAVLERISRYLADRVGDDCSVRLGGVDGARVERAGASLVVPLRAHGRIIGTLGLTRERSIRAYSAEERELVEALADRAALAIENARLYGAELAARRAAELAMSRVSRLQEVTSALSGAVTPHEVAKVIADQCVASLGARSAVIFALSDERRALALLGHHGVSEAELEGLHRLDLGAHRPACVAYRTGEAELIPSREAFLARYGASLRGSLEAAPAALLSLPLLLDARKVGAMTITFAEARDFDDETRGFAATLARQCAQALDRARLYDVERRSREQAALLVEAGTLLATSLDPDTTLRTLVRLAVPTLGDVCTVDAAGEGELRIVAVAHVDRTQEESVRELRRHFPIRLDDTQHPAAKAIRTGKPQVRYEATDATTASSTLDDDQLRLAMSIGTRSAVFLPLLSRGKVLGVLTLGQLEQRYAPGDVAFLQEFARRAALGLDNAALYEAEQRERRAAEEAAERARRLQLVTAALSGAVTPAQVADAVVGQGADALEAVVGLMAHLTEDGRTLELVGDRGLPPGVAERWRRFPIETAIPLAEAARTGEPVWVESSSTGAPRFPALSGDDAFLGGESLASLPLKVEGRVLGALAFRFASPRVPTAAEKAFLTTLANQCSIALERARLYEAERQANRLKDEFLGIVSHELRTPLNAILGWVRMLRTGTVKEGALPRALETIERNATLQAQLVEDLMDASRIITGKLGLELRRVELSRVIEAAVDSVSPAATQKGIKVTAEIDASLGSVRGDANRLQQVVWNLLTNAIKFSPRDAGVAVRLCRAGDTAEIIVRDRGEGIAPAFLPHVFDRFRQGDATTTRRHGGLGLGLSIVRHLVEAHGGSVRAESPGKGGGATFTVEIPLPATPSEERPSVEGREPVRAVELRGLRVLLVEDEADSREILRQMLAFAGAEVETASNVPEALAILDKRLPDVLVSDIGMPGEDGFSLIRKVRAFPRGRGARLPAVALTAYATAEDRQRALSAGYHAHLTKPADAALLAGVIAELSRSAGSAA